MECTDIKKGMLVKTGTTMGIVLQDKTKFTHSNHYAWVYYFGPLQRNDNPCWVFLGSLSNIEKTTQ